jgi:hypothetical protein
MLTDIRPMPLINLSICPCGDSVLKDEIKLGTVYKLDFKDVELNWRYICGGCGRLMRVPVIRVDRDGSNGYLPQALFMKVGD